MREDILLAQLENTYNSFSESYKTIGNLSTIIVSAQAGLIGYVFSSEKYSLFLIAGFLSYFLAYEILVIGKILISCLINAIQIEEKLGIENQFSLAKRFIEKIRKIEDLVEMDSLYKISNSPTLIIIIIIGTLEMLVGVFFLHQLIVPNF